MPDWLITAAVVAGFAALAWFAFGRDPHWSSQDGRRFICRAQLVEPSGRSDGRWREVRGAITDDGMVTVSPRGLAGRALTGVWTPEAASPDDRGKKVSVLLRSERMLVLRMPSRSPASRLLVQLVEK